MAITTPEQICNIAMGLLGDDPIVALSTDTTERAILLNSLYAVTRDATVSARRWPEALKRVTLKAYTKPAATLTPAAVSGTDVIFTASVAVFTSTAVDVGKVIRGKTQGKATVITYTDTTHVHAEITENFADTSAIASQDWKYYYIPPAYGYVYSLLVPSGYLRVADIEKSVSTGLYQAWSVEDGYLLSNSEEVNALLIKQLTSESSFSTYLVESLALHLASKCAEPITGQLSKAQYFLKKYTDSLSFAFSKERRQDDQGLNETSTPALTDVRL